MTRQSRLFALPLFAVSLFAWPVAAQEVDCNDAETQQEMTFCAEQDWQVADADLNAAYVAAVSMMQTIDGNLPQSERGAEDNLRAAQRAWITFRDANCAAEGYVMHGGSAEPMLIYGCLARLSYFRAEELWVMSQTY